MTMYKSSIDVAVDTPSSRRFFDNSANHDALLTLSTIMIEFLFGIKITNLVEVHPMKIHVCYQIMHHDWLNYQRIVSTETTKPSEL
jgi:hypothetical protein